VKAITISTIPQTLFNDYDSEMIRLSCEDDPFILEEHHENRMHRMQNACEAVKF
jgi:hypothetical protein